jgi:cytochrome c-type biogenesis protein CcmF
MAVAPALPWRKAAAETMHHRLIWPAWAGTLTVVACVAFGLRGLGPLLAFGLAAFAGAAALRHLALSVRAARRAGEPAWRALLGRSNGGMVVHLGVVILAVGFAASSSYGHRAQFRLAPGESARLAGHSVTYLSTTVQERSNKRTTSAQVRVDGGKVYEPALHQFPFGSQAIGSPSVRTGPFSDVYLTLVVPPDAGGVAVIGVNVQPLIMWLWLGGTVMGLGTFLAAWPGRRRRPAAPESKPAVVEPDPARPEPATVPS